MPTSKFVTIQSADHCDFLRIQFWRLVISSFFRDNLITSRIKMNYIIFYNWVLKRLDQLQCIVWVCLCQDWEIVRMSKQKFSSFFLFTNDGFGYLFMYSNNSCLRRKWKAAIFWLREWRQLHCIVVGHASLTKLQSML